MHIRIVLCASQNGTTLEDKALLPWGANYFFSTFRGRAWYKGKQTGAHRSSLPCTNNSKSIKCIQPVFSTLRKHAYSNILKIAQPKKENFQIKKIGYFSYFCSKHDCGYSLEPPHGGGSNEYPQCMFLAK